MSSLFGIGEVTYGVEDAKIGVNNLNGSWGSAVDVPSVRSVRIRVNANNAELEGDDVITAVHSKPRSADITIEFGSVGLNVLAVLLNVSKISSGAAPNRVFTLHVNKYNANYIGLCARADSAEGGDTHLFIPKMKLMEGFEITVALNSFIMPSVTLRAILDTAFSDRLFSIVPHEAVTAVALPPVFATA